LAQSIPLPLNKSAAAQQHSDFGVVRKYRGQLAYRVTPAFGQHIRPAATRGGSELSAGDKLGRGVTLHSHGYCPK
jgi:hypothetical protein